MASWAPLKCRVSHAQEASQEPVNELTDEPINIEGTLTRVGPSTGTLEAIALGGY